MGQIIRLSDEESAKIWYKLSTYEDNMYSLWRASCLENRAFYFGNQASQAEITEIQGRGQYYIVINKIRKAMRTLAGMLAAASPKYKVVPVGEDDNLKASLGNRLLDWVWNNSGGETTFRRIVKDAMIDNIKYFHIIRSKDGRIKFVPLSFDDVIVDPSSRHPMFEDAEMICIRRYVPIEYVKSVYGVADVVFETPSSYYDLVSTTSGVSVQTANDFISKVYSSDRMYVNLYECYKKEYYRAEPEAPLSTRIIKDTVIGYKHTFREELDLNITEYPIVPVYVEDTENPYKRGEIHFLKDLQKFINKAYGVVLLNAQLMSNPKIFVRETDIPSADITEFEDNYSKPGSVSVLSGNAEAPIIVMGQPLNSAFFTLYQDAKMELDAATIPAQLQGLPSVQTAGSSHLLDQREVMLDSLKDFTSIIDLACSQVGKVALQFCSAYMKQEDMVRLLDSTNARARIEMYKQEGLNPDDDNSVSNYINKAKQEDRDSDEVEEHLAQARADFDFIKALEYYVKVPAFSNMDIVVIPGSYTPTYEMAMMRLMIELSQSGAVDPSVILRYAPLENRDELIERFDSIRRLTSQVERLEEENDSLKSSVEQMEGKIVNERVDKETIRETAKLEKLRAEEKVKALMRKYEHRLATREQRQAFNESLVEMMLKFKLDSINAREKDVANKESQPNVEIF